MAAELSAYDELTAVYRQLVAGYRHEVLMGYHYLGGFFPDWSRVLPPPAESRHRRPERTDAPGLNKNLNVLIHSWSPERFMTADKLAGLIYGLANAWDQLNDAYAKLGAAARDSRPTPNDVHAAAVVFPLM